MIMEIFRLLNQYFMMRINLMVLVLFLCTTSCKVYEKEVYIEQTINKRTVSINFKDFQYDAIVSIPVSFKIKNNTSEDRTYSNYYFNYSDGFNGSLGLLYKLENDLISKIKIGTKYELNKGDVFEYLYLSRHKINVKNQIYLKKLKRLEKDKSRNKEGKFELTNLDEFKKLFPNFLKNHANKDQLKISLGKQNGKYEYLTLDVKY